MKSAIFLWKYSLLKPRAIPYFRQCLRDQQLPSAELEELNWGRTMKLLAYAYRHVPFYRKRFDRIGLNPADISSPKHYRQVPVLTKQDIRENFTELVSDEARPRDLRLSTTGGSTGEPLKVFHEKRVVRAAMQWRILSWWGLQPGLSLASVYRQQLVSARDRLASWLVNWPGGRIHLDASNLTPQSMRTFLSNMQQRKPQLLHGYVGAVDELAAFILREGIRVPAPKVVWVTSSPLTQIQRHRIEKAFSAPVCDQYGCCEIYWLAAQCPCRRGLHAFHDVRRIEFVDDEGQPVPTGEIGDIVVTDLENKCFPFIRYRLGDRGRALPETCECGVTLPLIDHVRGRISDTIRTPSGRLVSGDYLTTIFDDTPDAVRQFQVYQAADFNIEVRVVLNPEYPGIPQLFGAVQNALAGRVNGEVQVRVVPVEHIPHIRGKQRYVVSEVGGSSAASGPVSEVAVGGS